MNKRIIILIIASILVIGAVTSVVYAAFNAEAILNKSAAFAFEKIIIPFLEKSEDKIEDVKSLGEPTVGRKTVEIWEDMYEISRQTIEDGRILYLHIFTKDIRNDMVLSNVIDYKIKDGTLYVYSKEGYAVIRQSNVCRVYITIPPEEYEKGYYNENGMHCSYSKVEDCDFVRYLSSFDEFLKHEQKILKELAE